MNKNSSNKEAPSEPVPGIDSPHIGQEGEEIEKSSSTEKLPNNDEEPEKLTKAEAFLLVVSICVSRKLRAASVMRS